MRATGKKIPPGIARFVAIAASLLGASLLAQEAFAFELFGHRFFEAEPDPDISPDAQRYTVAIDTVGADDDLHAAVLAASALWTGRDDTPPPSTAAFLSRVNAEYGRITAALYREGRYGGTIEITVGGQDPDAIAPDAVLPQPVKVAMRVTPGPLFRFGQVEITGAPPPGPEDTDFKKSTPAEIGLAVGEPARAGAVTGSEKLLIDAWRRRGHPLASIVRRDTIAEHDSSTLDVAITVDPGPAATFGPLAVTGTSRMDPRYTAWMTGIEPGAPYDPAVIERGQKNLRRLQVFSSQRIEEAKALGPNGQLPLTLNVAERPLHVFGGGVSYATEDGAGVEAYWQHRNLFGHAESFKLSGAVNGIAGVDPKDFNYDLSATFTRPGIITPFTDFTAALEATRETPDTYTETAITAKVGLSHAITDELTASVGLGVTASRDEDAQGTDKFLLTGLPIGLAYDSRDDKTDPHEGFNAKVSAEPFYEANFGNAGVITDASVTSYLALDREGRFVIAGRLAAGSILGAPIDEMPNGRLYYAGGGSSVRGYAYRSLGPKDNGVVTGGLSRLEGSVELRAKVSESFGVVGFVDAGNAFASNYPDFADGLRFAAGAGIRYYTGLGPVRLDVALPLDHEPGDSTFGVYIGLGQSF
ncbi:Outer membrane protein [uncultured Pleomorphomonas sp.]|uniref:Outer membrane protein n=1 Tax=uncultured Pleomorphomonas sp. TaxID=442121 RepID=A0A212LIX9_9HYPH|nr:autotransporter assembly complex family protein [uncultured Pleomorphomonas sp.]SCM77501.1 Outer membrane protein [uncultured Pleomorphomonas sp.]